MNLIPESIRSGQSTYPFPDIDIISVRFLCYQSNAEEYKLVIFADFLPRKYGKKSIDGTQLFQPLEGNVLCENFTSQREAQEMADKFLAYLSSLGSRFLTVPWCTSPRGIVFKHTFNLSVATMQKTEEKLLPFEENLFPYCMYPPLPVAPKRSELDPYWVSYMHYKPYKKGWLVDESLFETLYHPYPVVLACGKVMTPDLEGKVIAVRLKEKELAAARENFNSALNALPLDALPAVSAFKGDLGKDMRE